MEVINEFADKYGILIIGIGLAIMIFLTFFRHIIERYYRNISKRS